MDWDQLQSISDRWLLAFGAVVALVATGGSLFLSEVWGLVPCDLCWYQRILMYPLVVILGVATYEARETAYRSALPLSVAGIVVAAHHTRLQMTASGGSCTLGGGCSSVQYRLQPLGLTVPNLSLIAFVLVTGVCVALWYRSRP